jgi:hypothetical protein
MAIERGEARRVAMAIKWMLAPRPDGHHTGCL